MKRRILQTLITAIVMSSLIVTPVLATPQDDTADSFEQKKSEAEAKAKEQMDAIEQQKSETQAQANSVNNELVELLVDYNALQDDMKTQEKRIGEAEVDLQDAEAKEKKQYDDMKLRIKYMYEEGDSNFFSTLFSAESYSDLISKAEYIKKVHDYDRKMLNKYVETKNEVAELKENLEEGQAEMQALSEEMDVQKENLETTLTQMRAQIEDFDNQLDDAKAAAEEELKRIQEEQRLAEEAEAAARAQQEAEEAARAQQAAQESQNQADSIQNGQNSGDDKKEDSSDKKQEESTSGSDKSDKNDDKSDSKDDKTDNVSAPSSSNASLGQQIADMGCNYIGINMYMEALA